ncbi:MAG TPA: maltose ABC transporter permease MalG [Firmicutes bacterium]|jgi:ABC-type maltose transport system permease subunit|nr:maltose ABC transporter permease MalG [Bacillota bacterium]HBT15407.1 maltose ABC transporter permease MalG [Bacillota bacterium]
MINYRLKRGLKHIVIWVFIMFAIFPIIWALSAALNPSNTLMGQRLIPENASLKNFVALFNNKQHPFPIWIWNSVKISLIVSLITVILTSLAAYPFSRFRFKGRRQGLFIILLVQIFPQMLAMVAIYLLFLNIQNYIPILSINTHMAVIVIYLGGAVGINTWLLKGYFDTISRSLEEAAQIDGATRFQAYYKIILPLAKPILAALFVIQFINTYNEYVLASIMLNSSDKFTLAVGLQMFISENYGQRWGVFSAAALLGAIPITVLFLVVQDYLVTGLTGGAVKE